MKQRAGGVARSVPALCEALARQGGRCLLVTQRPRHAPGETLRVPSAELVETHLLDGYDWERLRFSYTPGLSRRLAELCRQASPWVLHDHGLWLQMNHATAVTARRLRIRRVVSPRGMLEEWSLAWRGWKKRLAWRAYQQGDLESAAAFCVTSRAEADSVRALGFRQPVAVIPNGVDLPELGPGAARATSRSAVFMSRLHPKKGLLDLVTAWDRAAPSGWRLIIAGPDEDGHRAVVEQAALRSRAAGSIFFVGPVEGAAKHALLRAADLFVLPSYSENFGIVVGEALAYAVPVITTTATPWELLRVTGCGWWVEPGVAALESALKEAASLSREERAQMGRRGRALIEERFSWRNVARNHIEFYGCVASGASLPAALAG